ncbi:hypothetical protein M426DRAFT_317109, partial [Hypoxylon sp. CI-4A]
MRCLQYPRALTRASLYGEEAFHYDCELENQAIRSDNNGNPDSLKNSKSHCSTRVFEWMSDTWTEFVNSGSYKQGSVTEPLDSGCFLDYSDASDNSDIESGWDDLDIPCKLSSVSSQCGS